MKGVLPGCTAMSRMRGIRSGRAGCRALMCQARLVMAFLAAFLLFALPARAMEILDHAVLSVQTERDSAPRSLGDVRLPYHWDKLNGAVGGRAQFSFDYETADPASPQALHIPRIGNTFEIFLNGALIGRAGEPGNDEDYAKQPRFFPIPPGVLQERNTLQVTIRAQAARVAGLSPVVIGPEKEVRADYESNYRLRVTASMIVCVASSVLATLSLLLWFRQREPLYAFYGLSELLWALQVGDVLTERPPLPWPWWGVVIWCAYAMAPALICKFTLVVMERHEGLFKRLTDWHLLLTLPVVILARLGSWLWLWPVWKAVVVLLCVTVAVIVVRQGLRSSALEKRVLAFAVIATVGAGIRDLVYFVLLPGTGILPAYASYGGVSWVRYLWVAFGLTLAWIIAERLRKSTLAVARMNRTLAERLLEREAELEAMYKRQADVERQQAMVEERQRLMRDMHDGFGSQLLGALHLAQNPGVPKETLALQLRDALDQLKLTVDAMQDTEGDITTLLGSLRYRLGPRLKAAGVELAWEVNPLPPISGWTLQHSRDLQMLLFEAFSNIIVHAGASRASLTAVADGGRIRITLGDNGRGFDPAGSSAGHGMRNMRSRAARLGAELDIRASGDGTQVCLNLPIPEV